jgi:hypothetical protein
MCPFDERTGAGEVAETFWSPLLTAVTAMQRREDVFFAGRNQIDGFQSVWVVSMGHLMGLFDAPWLGIRPTRKLVMLRYAEFHRVEQGRIVETAQFCDIPHLMVQAGQNPFGPATAQHLVQPGPRTHDGLLRDPQPQAEGEATLAAINAMISDLGTWGLGLPLEEELRRSWHEDMLWWGPEGIGATYTIPRYAAQHSGPFRAAFAERSSTGHIARLAEGHFGGFFGWPNFTARHTGGFMGLRAATPAPSSGSSTSTAARATSWPRTGSSSTCCISTARRAWTCWRGCGPSGGKRAALPPRCALRRAAHNPAV